MQKKSCIWEKVVNNPEKPDDGIAENDETEYPEEIKPWRQRLSEVLQIWIHMDLKDWHREF